MGYLVPRGGGQPRRKETRWDQLRMVGTGHVGCPHGSLSCWWRQAVRPSPSGGLGQGADGAVRVNCDEAIGEGVPGSDPGTGSVGILGVVGLPASPQHMSLQTSASGESGPGMRLFAKQGLDAKATAQFEILVPAEYVGRAAVVWGNPGTPTTHLLFGPCGSIPTTTGWLSYAGGYLVADPMCLPLLVRSAGHEERVTIGVGRPCPGQRANPGHSDP